MATGQATVRSAKWQLTVTWQLPTWPRVPEYWRATPTEQRPLLGEAGVVEDQHAIAVGGQAKQLLDVLPIEVILVPVDGRQEALEALLAGLWDDLGEGVAVLVGVRGEQPSEVAFQGLGPLAPVEVDPEGGEELGQLGQGNRQGRVGFVSFSYNYYECREPKYS